MGDDGLLCLHLSLRKIRSARDARFGPDWQTERYRRESKGKPEGKFQPRVSVAESGVI